MSKLPNTDHLAKQIGALRVLVEGHDDMQQLLDLAADEADRRAVEQETSRRLAWRVAGAGMGLALVAFLVAGGAVATAMRPAAPPKVLVVDKAGGVVQPLVSLAEFQMSPQEATIRRYVDTFVTHCEGYSWEQADINYQTCAAFLSPQLQAEWVKKWDKGNPDSPPNKYKNTTRIRVKVGSIAVLRNGLGAAIGARASFKRTVLVNGVAEGPATDWIETLSFHWVNQPAREEDRRINDLGWEVTDATADRDLIQPAPPQAAAQAAPAPGAQMAVVAPKVTP